MKLLDKLFWFLAGKPPWGTGTKPVEEKDDVDRCHEKYNKSGELTYGDMEGKEE